LSGWRDAPSPHDLDPFSVAIGFALLAGLLALGLPSLDSLCLALASLAGAGWAMQRNRYPGRRSLGAGRGAIAAATVAAGAGFFLVAPGPWAIGRGLVLAASLLPLWRFERTARLATGGRGGPL
jgi:hypothetical protein